MTKRKRAIWTKRQRKRVIQLTRQYKENGIKLLLEHWQNVRELFCLLPGDWNRRIDFEQLELVKTTFIRSNFRHLETDILFTAPLLDARGRRTRKKLRIYVFFGTCGW